MIRLGDVKQWRFFPRTLGSQLIVVTVLAILLSNAMVVFWFAFGHERDNDRARTERLLDRAAATAILMSKIPPQTRDAALKAISGDFWGIFGLHAGVIPAVPMSAEESKLVGHLRSVLPGAMAGGAVGVHFRPTIMSPGPPSFPGRPPHGGGPQSDPGMVPKMPPHFQGERPDGRPVIFSPGVRLMEVVIPIAADTQVVAVFFRPQGPMWSAQLLTAALITILLSSLAAAVIAQRVTRPMSKLAEAASVVARGGKALPVPERGPEDVSRAASAFNAMADQVSRTLESQRHLLSAVGHDLRTPITAMRINIEFVQDEELAERLVKNLDELQALTEAVLSAARGRSGEALRQIDVSALVESICADLDDLHKPVEWLGGVSAPCMCRPDEIRRAVRNLIENAVAYGQKAAVAVTETPTAWRISIEDEGPGIPEADRVRVFEPFVRLEGSRNTATGGVGLGLTLARSIVEGHGGTITFSDRKPGPGFCVALTLPRTKRS